MNNNKLFLNSDKTHLLIMASSKSHSNHNDYGIQLNTGTEIIDPSPEERLLAANLTNNFLWNSHVRDHKKSVISTLKTKNNALSIISSYSSFKVRKMLANGMIMSHILYLIQLYGGCSEELLYALQVQQNRAARMVCKRPWYTSTKELLLQTGWLNVKQMVAYYSTLNFFKTRQNGVPKYIHSLITEPFKCKTRMAQTGGIKQTRNFKSRIGKSSFIYRTIDLWNNIPTKIRMEKSQKVFSCKLREWVQTNI